MQITLRMRYATSRRWQGCWSSGTRITSRASSVFMTTKSTWHNIPLEEVDRGKAEVGAFLNRLLGRAHRHPQRHVYGRAANGTNRRHPRDEHGRNEGWAFPQRPFPLRDGRGAQADGLDAASDRHQHRAFSGYNTAGMVIADRPRHLRQVARAAARASLSAKQPATSARS
jgi:hypothetical protein